VDRFPITTTEAEPRAATPRSSRRIVTGFAVLAALACVACFVYLVRTSGSSNLSWKEIWIDNFNGPAGGGINRGSWKFDTGHGVFGNNEIETMTAKRSNVHLDGHGDLDIVVHGHGTPGNAGSAWTSGRIQTRRLFTPPAGHVMMVTAGIRQPDPAHGLGYWPGFWMLGPKGWPKNGEIDILEDINALSMHSGTFHCGNLTQRNPDGTFGPCHENNGIGSGQRPCPGCQRGFHSYSVVIDRRDKSDEQIRWYFDGGEFFSVSESAVGRAAWTAAVDHGFSIILNVAVGGSYPDVVCKCLTPTNRTSSGVAMTVRYVAVYTS
jgi:beta-glucanase (GH16 family)